MPATARQAKALPAYSPSRKRRSRRPEPSRGRSQLRVAGPARRTASAVTHLPESVAVVGISRSRLWIAVVGLLLTGIVAVNVITVSYGATSGRIQAEIQNIERQNSILKSQRIEAISIPQVQKAASQAGMIVPETTDIRYRTYSSSDLGAAAQRLAADGG